VFVLLYAAFHMYWFIVDCAACYVMKETGG